MTYIIKHLSVKFAHGCNFSSLNILIHARVYVFSSGWGEKKSLIKSPFFNELSG